MQAMTFGEAIQDFSRLMDQVNEAHEPCVVTHDAHKPVVVLSLEDFNAWQETAYLTRSLANTRDLLQALEEIRARKNLGQHALIETP